MALGMMLPGMISGSLQELLGYQHFFIYVLICTLPGFLIIPFLKIDPAFGIKKERIVQMKLDKLKAELKGDLFTDKMHRILYATDASAYRELPLAVVRPKDKDDIKKTIAFAKK